MGNSVSFLTVSSSMSWHGSRGAFSSILYRFNATPHRRRRILGCHMHNLCVPDAGFRVSGFEKWLKTIFEGIQKSLCKKFCKILYRLGGVALKQQLQMKKGSPRTAAAKKLLAVKNLIRYVLGKVTNFALFFYVMSVLHKKSSQSLRPSLGRIG